MKRFYVLGVLMFIALIAVFSTMRAQNLELVRSSTKDSTITIELSMPRFNYLKDKTFQDNLNSQIESNVKNLCSRFVISQHKMRLVACNGCLTRRM